MKTKIAVLSALLSGLCAPAIAGDVTIGVLMPLSGKGAAFGAQESLAVQMFIEKYGEDLGNGNKLKLVKYDTRGENADAISLVRKLIDSDKAVAVVGPMFSGESEVAFPLAVRGQTVVVTPTGAKPGITAANRPWTFRMALTTDKLDAALVERWLKMQSKPIKTAVVLVDNKDAVSASDGNAVLPAALKAHGVKILDTISFQTGDIDYSGQVTRAKGLSPDAIVLAALYNEGANAVREIRKQGMTQPIVAGLGIMDPRFIRLAGPAADGVMTANDFFRENPKPSVVEWVTEFNKRFGDLPGNAPALYYDTMFVMRHCLMTAKVTGADLKADRAKVKDCWAGIKGVEAPLTGPTNMDADGSAERQPVVLLVKDGKFNAVR
jgi:branched-chain amino acid transport system substrate-binding protein